MSSPPKKRERKGALCPSAFKTVNAAARLSALTFAAMRKEPIGLIEGCVHQLLGFVNLVAIKLARAEMKASEQDAQEGAAVLYGIWRAVRDAHTVFVGDCEHAYHRARNLQTFSFRSLEYTCAVDAALWYGTEILKDAWETAGLAGDPVRMSFPFPVFVARHKELCARFSADERFSKDQLGRDGSLLTSAVQLECAEATRMQRQEVAQSASRNGKVAATAQTPTAEPAAQATAANKGGRPRSDKVEEVQAYIYNRWIIGDKLAAIRAGAEAEFRSDRAPKEDAHVTREALRYAQKKGLPTNRKK